MQTVGEGRREGAGYRPRQDFNTHLCTAAQGGTVSVSCGPCARTYLHICLTREREVTARREEEERKRQKGAPPIAKEN